MGIIQKKRGQKMNIIYKNMAVDVPEGTTVYENFIEVINSEENIIACIVNNEVKSLDYVLKENDEVELMNTSARDGARIYTRGLLFTEITSILDVNLIFLVTMLSPFSVT